MVGDAEALAANPRTDTQVGTLETRAAQRARGHGTRPRCDHPARCGNSGADRNQPGRNRKKLASVE